MTIQKPIEVVSATRLSRADFMLRSALGLSLQRLADARITASIAFQNRVGLPAVYNHRLAQSSAEVLLFVHDDVWIDDIYLADRLLQACAAFDVVGVVGNTHCGERQVSWAFTDEHLTWDAEERLSGAIANGTEPFGRVSRFGSSTTSCRLVDGVFRRHRPAGHGDREAAAAQQRAALPRARSLTPVSQFTSPADLCGSWHDISHER